MRAVPTLNFERTEGASVAPRPSALAKPNDLKPLQKLLFYLSSSRFLLQGRVKGSRCKSLDLFYVFDVQIEGG
jgi:hypothetical protein